MKEFIDKLISRLEEERNNAEDKALVEFGANGHSLDFEYLNGRCGAYNHAISIVNELAEEYKGKKVNSDLISRSEVIKKLNEIYLDNPWDSKEDILEKAIGRVEHIAPYTEGE